MTSAWFRRTRRSGRSTATALVSALALTALAACGTSSSGNNDNGSGGGSSDPSAPLDPKTKLTLTIDCMPPAAKAAELKEWNEDVKAFNKTYPNIRIEGRSTPGQCLEPPRFTAMLKAKSQPDVFYTYFTDLQQVLDNAGAEDIFAYVNAKTVPALADIDPDVMNSLKHDGKLYGLPTSNYTMGLLINRKLFEQAGLDPDNPPRTWEEVRAAAKKIAGLGKGIAGYGEYSAGNTGGWHFTATMYGLGGDIVDASGNKAAFNSDLGKQIAGTSTPCAGRTTAWARLSCSSGATCKSRSPATSSECSSPRRTTSRTWSSNWAPSTRTSAWGRSPASGTPSSAATTT